MTQNIVGYVGSFLKHAVGVLMLCWQRMVRAGLVAFGVGFVLALLAAVIITGQAFPGALAVMVALLFGVGLGYAVAMTILVEEFILGAIDLIHLLEGDVAKVAHISEAIAEREFGEVGQGLRRFIGLPTTGDPRKVTPAARLILQRTPATPATGARMAEAAAALGAVGAAALAARAATRAPQAPPEEPPTTSEWAPIGEPVPADRLPRIAWTLEHEAVKPPPASQEPAAPSATTPTDVASATASAGVGQIAHEEPAPPPEPAAPALMEDEASLEDERLVAPAAVAFRFDDEPAPATTPLPPEDEAAPNEPITLDDMPMFNPEMLAPAPATTPLAQTADTASTSPQPETLPELDPAMLTAAPATTPIAHEEPDAAPTLDPAMLAPAPTTTPIAPEEPQAMPPAPAPAADATPEPEPVSSPNGRTAFARITQPIEDLGTAFDQINRSGAGAVSTPRASAPESGLWERLSQALINRAGAPSGPFAAPQASRTSAAEPPTTPADIPSDDADTTAQG